MEVIGIQWLDDGKRARHTKINPAVLFIPINCRLTLEIFNIEKDQYMKRNHPITQIESKQNIFSVFMLIILKHTQNLA